MYILLNFHILYHVQSRLQACMQYSKCDLTNDLYSPTIVFLLLLFIVLLIKPNLIPSLSGLYTLLRYLEIAANNNSQILFFIYFHKLLAFQEIFFFPIINNFIV
jgi:hypothetical protein